MERIFKNLKALVSSNPEKFFMNVSDYRGVRVAAFDYALTIPNNFAGADAFECRGSVFVVDSDGNYVSTLALPFEKFFNIHEYDFGNNEALYETVRETFGVDIRGSEDLGKLPIKYVMDKEDGSIITAFEIDGEIHCKSNSSLTSDYAQWAEEMLYKDNTLYNASKSLTDKNWCVIYEMLLTKLPIVIQHTEDKLVVLGVRNRITGEYMSYEDVVSHFGADRVVKVKNHTFSEITDLMNTLENTEGFVVQTVCGLRYKAKTAWYIERHNRVSTLFSSPRHVWTAYIDGTLDDCYEAFKENLVNKARLDEAVSLCDNLYVSIIHNGQALFDSLRGCDRRDFFKKVAEHNRGGTQCRMEGLYATSLLDLPKKDAIEQLKSKLLVRDIISGLGIIGWRF